MHQSIGIRDAKARLSELLRDARRGRSWIITERGIPIAKVVPMNDDKSLEQRVEQLVARGILSPAKSGKSRIPPPIKILNNPAREMLEADRDR